MMLFSVKAQSTNNYDTYYQKYQDTKSFVEYKREMMKFALEKKEFKTLKIELDKYKRSL